MQIPAVTEETAWKLQQKLKVELQCDPILCLSTHRHTHTHTHTVPTNLKRQMHSYVLGSIISNSQDMEATYMSSIQVQKMEMWAPKSLRMVTAAMKLKDTCSLEEKPR